MEKIKCILGLHNFQKWKLIEEDKYENTLIRNCINCNKIDKYIGLTENCIVTNDIFPYVMKH